MLSTVWGYMGIAGGRQALAPQAPRRASLEGQGEELSGDGVDVWEPAGQCLHWASASTRSPWTKCRREVLLFFGGFHCARW